MKKRALSTKKVPECAWTKQICDELTAIGALIRVISGGLQSSGLPDRLVIHANWSGLLEFKSADGALRMNQSITLRDIHRRNADFAYVIREPNLIQVAVAASIDASLCKTIAEFDGTGGGLMDVLYSLRQQSVMELG